jgi:hypothetical protein
MCLKFNLDTKNTLKLTSLCIPSKIKSMAYAMMSKYFSKIQFQNVYEPCTFWAILHVFCVFSGEATNTNFIVFGLQLPGLEPKIYRTRGEHANHYATDAVEAIYQRIDNTLNG